MENGMVYGLFCPIEQRIVYVGQTTLSARKKLKLCKIHRDASYTEWFDKLRLAGCIDKVELRVLEADISIDVIAQREEYWIEVYSGHNQLLNKNKVPHCDRKMSANSYSMYRYFAIDVQLMQGKSTLLDLMRVCGDVSKRTIQLDLEAMRYDDGLGFFAPIVYGKKTKTYHYSDKGYSIFRVIEERFYKEQKR